MSFQSNLNAMLGACWDRGWLPRPRLELAELEKAAFGKPGLPLSWGYDEIREPAAQLVASLNEDAELNALGRAMAWGQIVRMLRDRDRAERLWQRSSDILDREVDRPIIILGHMRSGTTRLHRLLACDPRLSHSRFWEATNPVPRRSGGGFDSRPAEAMIGLALIHGLNPALKAIHPTSIGAAEEEFGLFGLSVHGAQIEAQWRVPRFAAYWKQANRRPVYATFRKLVQTMDWSRRKPAGSMRLLKAPQFMEDLDLVLDMFPGARLICLNRDPLSMVGSSVSLVWHQMKIQSDAVDKAWIGTEWLEKIARRERAARQVRAARSDVPQIDISYADMERDWATEIRRIYAFLGLDLDGRTEGRMAGLEQRSRHGRFRNHSYRLEDFGLDAHMVEKRIGAARGLPI